MARNEEVIAKLEAVVGRLADAIEDPDELGNASVLAYASAAQQFAEARAWMANPSQPHGGTTTVSS